MVPFCDMDDHMVCSIASADANNFAIHRERSFPAGGDGIQVSTILASGLFTLLKESTQIFVSNWIYSYNDLK